MGMAGGARQWPDMLGHADGACYARRWREGRMTDRNARALLVLSWCWLVLVAAYSVWRVEPTIRTAPSLQAPALGFGELSWTLPRD
jgi:hypothetical protein